MTWKIIRKGVKILNKLSFVKVIKGELHPFLKDITFVGYIKKDIEFVAFGYLIEDEEKYFKGLLKIAKQDDHCDFKTIEDVKRYVNNNKKYLTLKEGDYEIVEGTF